MGSSDMAMLWERFLAAANAKMDRDDALLASAAAGGPFWGMGKPAADTVEMQGLALTSDDGRDDEAHLRQRIDTLEHELAKADRRAAEQERIIAGYRTAHRMLADVIGEDPGTASEMVGCVEVKLRALRDALAEALELYDEKPGSSEWGGCLCPSNGWGHAQDCHLKRIAELRQLLGIKCRGCDDTRSTSCGADDCPIPRQMAGDLETL